MSFNSNPSRVEYVVNTKTTTFTFNFKIFEPENLLVYKIPSGTLPDDETNKLLLNVDYTISINGDLGGFITLLKTPTIHDIIIIQRTLSIDRVTDFVNNGGIYSDVLNNDQDYQTYLIGDNEIEKREEQANVMQLPTPTQMQIIEYILNHTSEDIYQRDLEDILNLRRATVSGVLHTMEKNNLIRRVTDNEDTRSKKILVSICQAHL